MFFHDAKNRDLRNITTIKRSIKTLNLKYVDALIYYSLFKPKAYKRAIAFLQDDSRLHVSIDIRGHHCK